MGQPKRVIKLAYYQKAAVRAELRAAKFQPHTRVKIYTICPQQIRTLWVIHEIYAYWSSTP
jgi:hypothetical protein